MRKALLEQVKGKGVLTESKRAAAENFILNEATYEQLLNLVYNPARETNYMKTEALEKVALEAYEAHLKAPAAKVVKESVFGKVEEAISVAGTKKLASAGWNAAKGKIAAAGGSELKQGLKNMGDKSMFSKTIRKTGRGQVASGAKKLAKAGAKKAALPTGIAATGYVAGRRAKKKKD